MTDGATAQATASSPEEEDALPAGLPEPVLPDWDGAGLHRVVPSLLGELAHPGRTPLPDWFPEPVAGADQVVLLVLDGLGEEQLRERRSLAPVLSGGVGGPITSVALTSSVKPAFCAMML